MNSIVIIGGGLAGYTLARELRKLDKTTPLVMLMADDGAFYSKPMLSNALAQKKNAAALLISSAAKMAADLNADIRPHTRVLAIDRAAQTLTLQGPQGGETSLGYGCLVLALGADPIRLPLLGDGEVLSVNDRADYAVFRTALEGKQRIAILGAGLIGCEFANDLAGAGYSVTVFDVAPQPLGRLLPPAAGRYMAERLGAAGINWRFATSLTQVSKNGSGLTLGYGAGITEDFDLLLSAVGLKPRMDLARAAGLTLQRGIVVDHFLRTSDPSIYALGDCAEVMGQVLPFVMPIMQGARALAATLAGTPKAVVYPAMPVVVKTPACPTVVCPPPPGAQGAWREESTPAGLRAIFEDSQGQPLGFALLGDATHEKQALSAKLSSSLV